MNALEDLRGRVAAGLTAGKATLPNGFASQVAVIDDMVDAVTPPAYLLVWSEPWLTPSTFCCHLAHLEVVCIGPRIEPGPGIAQLEMLVNAAIPAVRPIAPDVQVGPPYRYDIGQMQYLAARLLLAVRLSIQPEV